MSEVLELAELSENDRVPNVKIGPARVTTKLDIEGAPGLDGFLNFLDEAILGDNLGFWFGRRFGYSFLHRYGPYVRLTEPRLKIGQLLFQRHGGKVVFFGRFTALLRTYAALLAGANKFNAGRFFIWNASGGITWAATFGLGGYFFGWSIEYLAGPLSIGLFAAVIVGGVALYFLFKKHEALLLVEAERMLDVDAGA